MYKTKQTSYSRKEPVMLLCASDSLMAWYYTSSFWLWWMFLVILLQHSQLEEQHLQERQSLDSVHSATTGWVCQMMSEQLIVLRRCSLRYICMLRSSGWCSVVVDSLGLNLYFIFFLFCYMLLTHIINEPCLFWVFSTSGSDCLERLISEMAYYCKARHKTSHSLIHCLGFLTPKARACLDHLEKWLMIVQSAVVTSLAPHHLVSDYCPQKNQLAADAAIWMFIYAPITPPWCSMQHWPAT